MNGGHCYFFTSWIQSKCATRVGFIFHLALITSFCRIANVGRLTLQCHSDCWLCREHNKKSALIQKPYVCIQENLIKMNIKNPVSTRGRGNPSCMRVKIWTLLARAQYWLTVSHFGICQKSALQHAGESCFKDGVFLEALHSAKREAEGNCLFLGAPDLPWPTGAGC